MQFINYNISQDIGKDYTQYITKYYSFILTNVSIFVITHKNLISREQTCLFCGSSHPRQS